MYMYISRSFEKFIYIVFNEYIANYRRDRNPIHVKNNTLIRRQRVYSRRLTFDKIRTKVTKARRWFIIDFCSQTA